MNLTNQEISELSSSLETALAIQLIKRTPILHLNLKAIWFDMIASLEKKEEYRDIKPSWSRIFTDKGIKIKGKHYRPEDILICFSNGYAKNRRQMLFKLDRVAKREGIAEWGAREGKRYHCLVLGNKIWQGHRMELQETIVSAASSR